METVETVFWFLQPFPWTTKEGTMETHGPRALDCPLLAQMQVENGLREHGNDGVASPAQAAKGAKSSPFCGLLLCRPLMTSVKGSHQD